MKCDNCGHDISESSKIECNICGEEYCTFCVEDYKEHMSDVHNEEEVNEEEE